MIRALVFLGLALVLLAANIWLVIYAWRAFFGGSSTVIAGMRVVGKEDADGKLGMTLAHMLVARLGKIDQDMRGALRVLEAAEGPWSAVGPRTQDRDNTEFFFPKEVFEPLDIAVSVGGVEVGGILSWLHRAAAEGNSVQISVEFGESKALVAGVLDTSTGETLYLEIDKDISNDAIVSAAAYQMAQNSVAQRIPEVGALEWHEFRDLFLVLTETASLNRKVALGAEPGPRYGDLSKRLEPIVLKMDEWRALIRFAGDLARTAADYPKALAYYKQALALSEEGEVAHDDLSRIIEETQTQVAAVSTTVTVPASARLTVDSDDPRMKRILESPATASILRQLGVQSRQMKGAPTIAVFGGLPPEGSIPENQITLVGAATGRPPDDPMMSDYIATIVQTIRVVAPQAHFVFAGTVGKGGAFTSAEVLQSITQLLSARPRPDILLVTVGPLRGEAEEKVLMSAAEAGVLVVLAAGNEPKQPIPFEGKPLLDRVMVVSATRQNGEPTVFTQRGDKSFWAPGEAIPVMLKDESQGEAGLTVRSGTTYAAALGAAVAGRVISEMAGLALPDLIRILRDTSKEAAPSGPKILNLEAALASMN